MSPAVGAVASRSAAFLVIAITIPVVNLIPIPQLKETEFGCAIPTFRIGTVVPIVTLAVELALKTFRYPVAPEFTACPHTLFKQPALLFISVRLVVAAAKYVFAFDAPPVLFCATPVTASCVVGTCGYAPKVVLKEMLNASVPAVIAVFVITLAYSAPPVVNTDAPMATKEVCCDAAPATVMHAA